jgi:CheY-like chemotaxis protein
VPDQPDAFLSYTRRDDEFFSGAITSLRKLLELGVQVVTGQKHFSIFQDIDGVELGQQWQKRLDQAIVRTRFLIPIITPLFFQSDACRDELEKFMAHEKKQKRDDLILPVYFVTAPVLERADLLRDDAIATAISARQRDDWRLNANLPINDPQMRAAVMQLSLKIASAIDRAAVPSASASPRKTDRAKKTPTALVSEKARDSALKNAADTVKREEPEKKRDKQRKILWVDDRPDNNVFERRAMQPYNIKFELAESTGEALARLRKERFDAIISDMGRPPDLQAGYTLLNALRSSGDLTPFLIYAGSDSPEHLRLALSKGAQGSTNRSDTLIKNVLDSLETK